jgi:hypothetical protein
MHRLFLPLMISIQSTQVLNAQDCKQILEHGVFMRSNTDSLRIRTQPLLNWFSQSTFENYGQASEAGGKLGFSLDSLPISLSGHNRNTSWHDYQATLQTLDFSDSKVLEQFSNAIDQADRAIVAAWQTCILNARGTPHAAIGQTYDPRVFSVNLIYDPVGPRTSKRSAASPPGPRP